MSESNDVQAIEKISSVVGESHVKIILSNQCIKAQAFLVNRLKKQFDRQKEISKFISSDNLKLEAEIKNAEQEIKSLTLAHESIKSANVELKKEWHLAKERAQETLERIQTGEKKYEELWEQCKSRYESIDFVQNWIQAKNRNETLKEQVKILDDETQEIRKAIEVKKEKNFILTKERIIELANYMILEMPKTMETINNKNLQIKELSDEIERLENSRAIVSPNIQEDIASEVKRPQLSQMVENLNIYDWPNINKDDGNDSSLMPKLRLNTIDLDMLSVKLDQIKKTDAIITSPNKIIQKDIVGEGSIHKMITEIGHDEYISCYFNNPVNNVNNSKQADLKDDNYNNYSKRKLINILDDVKLDRDDALKLVSEANVSNLRGVDLIKPNDEIKESPKKMKIEEDVPDEQIEEIDLTANTQNILMPPTGFLDQFRSSQEKKKRVSFEIPLATQEPEERKTLDDSKDEILDTENNQQYNSPMNVSTASEESYTKIKDMILKKHNLDLSPPFVYAKNNVTHMKNGEAVVKSIFFKQSAEESKTVSSIIDVETEQIKITEATDDNDMQHATHSQAEKITTANKLFEMEVDGEMDSTEKAKIVYLPAHAQVQNEEKFDKPVAGLLFNHGPQGIPDSLDVSINTTGYEDGDDFPQYSSLLLSPKADLPIPMSNEKVEVVSQDVPNFLSGLRKTGLSFFNKISGNDSNTESIQQNAGNSFNFTFGSENKNNRGGIFNMFN